jgi:hypothetical protein
VEVQNNLKCRSFTYHVWIDLVERQVEHIFREENLLAAYDMLELYLWTCHCSPSYYRISEVCADPPLFCGAVARFKKQIRSA